MKLNDRYWGILYGVYLVLFVIIIGIVIVSCIKEVEPEPAPAVVVTDETPHPWMNRSYWDAVVIDKDDAYEIHCVHGIPILYHKRAEKMVVMDGWSKGAKTNAAAYALEACGDLHGEQWRDRWDSKKDEK